MVVLDRIGHCDLLPDATLVIVDDLQRTDSATLQDINNDSVVKVSSRLDLFVRLNIALFRLYVSSLIKPSWRVLVPTFARISSPP